MAPRATLALKRDPAGGLQLEFEMQHPFGSPGGGVPQQGLPSQWEKGRSNFPILERLLSALGLLHNPCLTEPRLTNSMRPLIHTGPPGLALFFVPSCRPGPYSACLQQGSLRVGGMCVCVHVCVHLYVSLCVHVCIYVWVPVWTSVVYVSMYLYMYICIHVLCV